jgi:hypothetical protein
MLEYFVALWYICGRLVYFPRFGLLYPEKYGSPVKDGELTSLA